MTWDVFLQTMLKLTVPGFYVGVIIVLILHFRHRIKGRPALPLHTHALRLVIFTTIVTLALSIAVFLLYTVLDLPAVNWGNE